MTRRLIEGLESRTLLSAAAAGSAELHGDTLTIKGTNLADVITVGYEEGRQSVFVYIGNSNGTFQQSFPASKLKKAEINAGNGDDIVVVNQAFGSFVSVQMNGGNGNDVLVAGDGRDKLNGGNGNDIILGGSSNDKLTGGNGDDIIYGQDGRDQVNGGKGSNILYGDAGRDNIKSQSKTDVIGATADDKLKDKKGATLLP